MKVEIDADELCELKRDADKNRNWDYHKVCYDSLKEKYEELEAERDWWREHAMDVSMDFDKQDEEIARIVCYAPAPESYHIDRLHELASNKGYE